MTAYILKTEKIKNQKRIWRYTQTHVSNFWLIKILKWSTECSGQEFYSNRRHFWQNFYFLIFVFWILSKTNIIWNLKLTPTVVHTDQPSVAGWSCIHAELEVRMYFFSMILTKNMPVVWVCKQRMNRIVHVYYTTQRETTL